MKIIEDFLSQSQFNHIKDTLLSDTFPYYYQPHVLEGYDDLGGIFKIPKKDENADYFFSHNLYTSKDKQSDRKLLDTILLPIILKLDVKQLVRAKVNLYTNQHRHIHTQYHIDSHNEDVKAAIYYVNTNNGYTKFETGEKASSLENSIVLFDAHKRHKAVSQTDTKTRVNININYL